MPETALFGNFLYTPPECLEYPSDKSFWLTLKHTPDDASGLIIPVLSQVNAAKVFLTVRLTIEEEELLGATNELEGSRSGAIDLWDDTRIETGDVWRTEIQEALDQTRVAILLVSADFMASNFIVGKELPPARRCRCYPR